MKSIINLRFGLFIVLLFSVYLTTFYNYLLFHSISEIFSILIAVGIFFFAWNSREFLKNNYFLFIGIAYLFIGITDLAHTFSYKGMGVFVEFDANLPTQLWITARYMESISLMMAFLFLKRKFNPHFLIATFTLITILVFSSIFYWKVFPDCFIEGSGLTSFKKNSEYLISSLLCTVIILFYKYRSQFDKSIYKLLITSTFLTIIAELAFTFYISVFGFSNLIGHFLKIISFYLIYQAIVKTGLKKPYNLLFKELKQSEESLKENETHLNEVNQKLKSEIIEHKQSQKIIKESEKKYRQMFEDNTAIKLLIDPEDGSIVNANQAALQFYGYERQKLIQSKIMDINILPPEEVVEEMQNAKLENRKFFNFQHRLASGEIRDVEVHSGPIISEGKHLLFSIINDVTERRKAENKISASLKEKETLLHEVHHRVKNNMQVISSLLKLQSDNIEDYQIKEVLKESQSRVYAMSAVHETLHGSENLSEIDLKTYLSKITTAIFQSNSNSSGNVKLKSDVEDSPISINQAYPIGLVVNELISNSLKYAFPDDRKGQITVKMKKLKKGLKLTVADNGVGIPDELDWKNSSTLGLKLVRTLVENQLDGSLDMESNNGTKFTIKFNIET